MLWTEEHCRFGRRITKRTWCRWEDVIKMVREKQCERVRWIKLAHSVQWRSFLLYKSLKYLDHLNMLLNIPVIFLVLYYTILYSTYCTILYCTVIVVVYTQLLYFICFLFVAMAYTGYSPGVFNSFVFVKLYRVMYSVQVVFLLTGMSFLSEYNVYFTIV
jgi:hypothetical protein